MSAFLCERIESVVRYFLSRSTTKTTGTLTWWVRSDSFHSTSAFTVTDHNTLNFDVHSHGYHNTKGSATFIRTSLRGGWVGLSFVLLKVRN